MTVMMVAALFFSVGCANLETNAYKTIGATATLVDATMNGWGDYVRAGKASPQDETTVKAIYLKYQQSMRVAQAAVMSYRLQPTNAPALNIAIDALDASRIELVTLIQILRKQ